MGVKHHIEFECDDVNAPVAGPHVEQQEWLPRSGLLPAAFFILPGP